jgi:Na+/H+ antiporter
VQGWLILGFLVVTTVLAVWSKRLGVAYPIVFVIGGALLGFVPNLPQIVLRPELVFLIVLPVLLGADAYTTDLFEFKRNLRPITLLAIGLVAFTTVMVAAIAHGVIADITWPAAFTLGAIIAPTDAIAAEAISEEIPFPRRIVTVISGESLVNDASALIIYRFAIAAAVSGTFVAGAVVPQFFLVSIGGIAVGLLVGVAVTWILKWLRKRELDDEFLVNIVILFSPFAGYLIAEAMGVSGVLSTVAGGIYLSRHSSVLTPDARLLSRGVWNMLTYLLNAFVFLLLGLQLHSIVTSLGHASFNRLLIYGIVISVAVIVLRFVWVFPATYVPRMLSRRLRERDPNPPWQWLVVLGWSGMRGIVSLAAALALPLTVVGGAPFPARNEIIFVTFAVILATLVGMGLTLPLMIRILRVYDDGRMQTKEISIRIKALEQGILRLRQLEPTFDSELEWEVQGRIVDEYQHRIEHLSRHLDGATETRSETALDHRLQNEALAAERDVIHSLRTRGEIPDDVFRRIQYDLDLADARLRQA